MTDYPEDLRLDEPALDHAASVIADMFREIVALRRDNDRLRGDVKVLEATIAQQNTQFWQYQNEIARLRQDADRA